MFEGRAAASELRPSAWGQEWPGQPVQALELRDEWLHKVELEPGSYPATLGGVARDAALATLREAWAADVAAQEVWVDGDKRVFARRYDVEVVGVWVGVHAAASARAQGG